MVNADGKIMTQPELVDYIISEGSKFFGVDLLKKKAGRTDWDKRRYFIVILYDYTALNWNDIREQLKYAQHGAVTYHYKKLKEEISNEAYGSDKTKLVYNQLINYLKLENNENERKDKQETSGLSREVSDEGNIGRVRKLA